MANYRFKAAEIEAMKKNILTHIEHEAETKTAWRLRCAIEGQLMCCRPSKREAARLERELALYEKLTKNDLPNWQNEPIQPATPTETPRISTQTAETVNVSAEGEKGAETREISRKPDGREAVCRFAPAWAAKKTLKYGYKLYCFNLYPNGEFSISVENRNGCRILTKDEFRELCTEPPQPPEAPQTVECTTDTPKPRETAEKRQNRAIGSAQHHQHSALGANGYAMLDNASATLTAMYVPRECSTADAAYW